MAARLPTWLTLPAFIPTKSKFKVRVCSARIARAEARRDARDGGGRTPPTVIASPPACLKIDVIFVILSTLLPCRPRVSRASAPGHLFLHAYKLTSTLLHTATPSSGFSRRVPRIRDARDSGWKRWIFFFFSFSLCDFHRHARHLLRVSSFLFSKGNLSGDRYCAAWPANDDGESMGIGGVVSEFVREFIEHEQRFASSFIFSQICN